MGLITDYLTARSDLAAARVARQAAAKLAADAAGVEATAPAPVEATPVAPKATKPPRLFQRCDVNRRHFMRWTGYAWTCDECAKGR
jgi:hypothetical protein